MIKSTLFHYLIFFTSLFSLIFFAPSLEPRPLKEIMQTKELRICLAGSSKDFYKKNARAFVKFLGKGVKGKYIKFEKWNDQFLNSKGEVVKEAEYTPEPLESGRCDLYPNDLVRLEWREKKLAYIPLFISRNTIIINKKDAYKLKDINSIAGKTAAVMKGTSFHNWLEDKNQNIFKNNPVKFMFLPQKKAIIAVDKGLADFALSGADGALWAVNNFAKNSVVAFPVGDKTEYGWCVRKNDINLQNKIEEFFNSQRNTIDSEININWKNLIGLSLGDFILFVTSNPSITKDKP